MKNSNFKKFDFVKKKDNKFINKRETEEEKLEREYQRRKFREAVLSYDWSKRVPVESKKTGKENAKFKQEDKKKSDYKTLSNALKSNLSSRKERLELFKKRVLFLKNNNIISKIKEKKILDFYLLKIKKLNFSIKLLFSRISLINYNRLFKKRKKTSFFSFFKRLSINDIILLKEKINSIDNNLVVQNINLFYYKEIMSYFSFSLLQNKILSRKSLNLLFIYINNKFKNKIINKYFSILFKLKMKKKKIILNKIMNFNNFTIYDVLKIYPFSYFIENKFFVKNLLFRNFWNKYYLNKPLLKVFFRKKFSKNKILKFALKKKNFRKIFSTYIPFKVLYFRKKFISLNKKLSLTKYDDNREMTPAEVSQQSFLKHALKKSVNKKEILSDIFKMKYPNLSKNKIDKLLTTHIQTETKLLKKFKKSRKIKLNKIFLKLSKFKKKLYFLNSKLRYLDINKTEFFLSKKLSLKLNKTSEYFNFLKKKSKYFLNLDYIYNKKYLEKKGIKYNVYGYKTIKVNKFNLKESLPKIKFKYKKNKQLFMNYIKKKKNYKYIIPKSIYSFYKKYRILFLRNSKKNKNIYLNLAKHFKKNKKFYFYKSTKKNALSINSQPEDLKKYYSFNNKRYLSFFRKRIIIKNQHISSFNNLYLSKIKKKYNKINFENSSFTYISKLDKSPVNFTFYYNKDYIYNIKKKILHLKKLTKRMLKNKNSNNNLSLNMKFVNIFLSKYSSENVIGKKQTEKSLYLLRKYDKFKKKRDYLNKLKNKNIKLVLSISELVNKSYLNNINSYINNKKIKDFNIDSFIKKSRSQNIFIQSVSYHPKLFIGEMSNYKNRDYIDAYWNVNSLYFKFIGFLIREGKRNKAEKIFNSSLSFIKEFVSGNPIFFFFQSIYNSQPLFEYIKHKKRYKTITIPRITPYSKRLTLSMRNISKNIRSNELLRKFRKIKFKNNLNTSYLLYNIFVSHFFVKGKIKKDLKDSLENAFSKKHFFRKGNSSKKNFKYNKLLKFMSFRKIKGYQF